MGRRATPSNSLSALVRQYFSLTQAELGRLLGLTRGQVAHVEAGRHVFSAAAQQLLFALAPAALAPASPTAEAAAELLPDPDPTLLEARLDRCRHEAAQLRWALRSLQARAQAARRWAAALPTLLDALAAGPAADHQRAWLRRQAVALTPDEAARYHLLRLRADALDAEAAALAALLPLAANQRILPAH